MILFVLILICLISQVVTILISDESPNMSHRFDIDLSPFLKLDESRYKFCESTSSTRCSCAEFCPPNATFCFCISPKNENNRNCETLLNDYCHRGNATLSTNFFACGSNGLKSEEEMYDSLCHAFAVTNKVFFLTRNSDPRCIRNELQIQVKMNNEPVYLGSFRQLNATLVLGGKGSYDKSCMEVFENYTKKILTSPFWLSAENISHVTQLSCKAIHKQDLNNAYFYAFNYRINAAISFTSTPKVVVKTTSPKNAAKKQSPKHVSPIEEVDFVCKFVVQPTDERFRPKIDIFRNGTQINSTSNFSFEFTEAITRPVKYECKGTITFVNCNPYFSAHEDSSHVIEFTERLTTTSTSKKVEVPTIPLKVTEKPAKDNSTTIVYIIVIFMVAAIVLVSVLVGIYCYMRKPLGKDKGGRKRGKNKKGYVVKAGNTKIKLMAEDQESRSSGSQSQSTESIQMKKDKGKSKRKFRFHRRGSGSDSRNRSSGASSSVVGKKKGSSSRSTIKKK